MAIKLKTTKTTKRDSVFLLYLNIFERLFFFFIFLLIARNFPADIYGNLITLLTAASIIAYVLDMGLPVFFQREIASGIKDPNKLFSNIILIVFVKFFVYSTIFFFIYIIFFKSINSGLFSVILVMVYLNSLAGLLNSALSGINHYKSQFISSFIPRLLILMIFIISIYVFHSNLFWLFTILLAGTFLQNVLLFYNTVTSGLSFSFKELDFKLTTGILKTSIPLALAVIFNFLYDKIDVLIIASLKNYTEVGYYNVGYGIYKASNITFTFLLTAGLTRVSYLSKRPAAVKLFFWKYLKILFWISLIINILLLTGAEPIIELLYTSKFQASIPVLQILSFSVFALAANNLTGTILNGTKNYRANMYITLSGLIINIIMNLFLIPAYGIIGAVFATLITEYFIFFGDTVFIIKFCRKNIPYVK